MAKFSSSVLLSPKVCLICICLFTAFFLTSCNSHLTPQVRHFSEGDYPDKLSQWGLVYVNEDQLKVNSQAVIYDLNTPLFSDYAHKLRTVWVPDGQVGQYTESAAMDLPVGSMVSKTFYYPRQGKKLLQIDDGGTLVSNQGLELQKVRLIETRLLIRYPSGWVGLPYVWIKISKMRC